MAKSTREIVLEHWVPALITACIGGFVVALLVPSIQTRFAEASAYRQRQLDLFESVGKNFNEYIIRRSRLHSVSARQYQEFDKTGEVSDQTRELIEKYRLERDQSAVLLRHDLVMAEQLFGADVRSEISEFLEWHNEYAQAPLSKQPPDAEYASWRERVLGEIVKVLRPRIRGIPR